MRIINIDGRISKIQGVVGTGSPVATKFPSWDCLNISSESCSSLIPYGR